MFSRVLWVISGVLLLMAGVLSILNPAVSLSALAVMIGVAMLVSGIIDILVFIKGSDILAGAGWILADGVLTIIMALFVLFNQTVTVLTLPFIFGMWVLFTGLSRTIASVDMQKLGIPGWGWFLALGIVLMLFGFLSFVKPVAAMFAIGLLMGIVLILEGIVALMKGLFSKRFLL